MGALRVDYAEKKAWQAKRKNARFAAIERMRETDGMKEQERLEMEQLKVNNPEEYKNRLAQQERAFKDREAQRKIERLQAAALERKQQEDNPVPEVDGATAAAAETAKIERKRARAKQIGKAEKFNWLPY